MNVRYGTRACYGVWGWLLLALPLTISAEEGRPALRILESQEQTQTILGEVRLESYGERSSRIAVGVDVSIPRDGLLDHLFLYEASRPVTRSLFFQGPARVVFSPYRVRLRALEEAIGFDLTIRGFAADAEPVGATEARYDVLSLANGRYLIYKSLDFNQLLSGLVEVALAETGQAELVKLQAAGVFQKDPSPDDEGACALSCSKNCRGSGSCSATCPDEGDCAVCECDENNIPLCECK